MGAIGNAIKGLTATMIGSGVANGKAVKNNKAIKEQAKIDEVNSQYNNVANETMQDVYKTTRKIDRNVFLDQFEQANSLAQQRQEFINLQTQSYKQRILNAGGLNTPKGQAIKKLMDNQVKPVQKQLRKDLTKFRKKGDK